LASAVDRDGHQHLGNAKHARDLRVGEPLNEAQGENLCPARLKFTDSSYQRLPQFSGITLTPSGNLNQFHGSIGLPRSHHIQSGIDGCPPEVALPVIGRIRAGSPQQSKEYGLQDIFRISCVSGYAVCRTKNQAVMRPKRSLEFVRDGDCRFL
jgi:hypothetical protein